MVLFCCRSKDKGATDDTDWKYIRAYCSGLFPDVHRALAQGVSERVLHLDRGVYGWWEAEMDMEGKGDYQPDVGRTPIAAPEPTIPVGAGSSQQQGNK